MTNTATTACPSGGAHVLSPLDDAPDGGTIHECTAEGCGHVEHHAADGTVRPILPSPATRLRSADWWQGVRDGLRRAATWRQGEKWVRFDGDEMSLARAIGLVNHEQAAELLMAGRADGGNTDPAPWTGFTVNLTPPAGADVAEEVA